MSETAPSVIRGVPLEPGETVVDEVLATLDGLHNTGNMYLSSRRLIWVAHRFRLPLTALLGDPLVSVRLADMQGCYARSFGLVVETAERRFRFGLYRWWFPVLLWWRLARRWADAINNSRGA